MSNLNFSNLTAPPTPHSPSPSLKVKPVEPEVNPSAPVLKQETTWTPNPSQFTGKDPLPTQAPQSQYVGPSYAQLLALSSAGQITHNAQGQLRLPSLDHLRGKSQMQQSAPSHGHFRIQEISNPQQAQLKAQPQAQFQEIFKAQLQPQFQGQFPGQTQPQPQGQFTAQQQPQPQPQGQFPGQLQAQSQGQFTAQAQPQPHGQFTAQPQSQPQGQFTAQPQPQHQGQFTAQPQPQPQGQFPAQPQAQHQGKLRTQSPSQPPSHRFPVSVFNAPANSQPPLSPHLPPNQQFVADSAFRRPVTYSSNQFNPQVQSGRPIQFPPQPQVVVNIQNGEQGTTEVPHYIKEYHHHTSLTQQILSQLKNSVRTSRAANLTEAELEILLGLRNDTKLTDQEVTSEIEALSRTLGLELGDDEGEVGFENQDLPDENKNGTVSSPSLANAKDKEVPKIVIPVDEKETNNGTTQGEKKSVDGDLGEFRILPYSEEDPGLLLVSIGNQRQQQMNPRTSRALGSRVQLSLTNTNAKQ
jgi:hypothetical protein